ncbi:MAG: Ig-like domain-containing protein [Clostridia bacterium]|nr:Ig-like domain-containing protein [Clostridia bacterium]
MKKTCFLILLTLILSVCCVFPAAAADPVPVESITLDQSSAVVSVGKTLNVKAAIAPKNATAKKLEWSSSDEAIATVQNGKVKGIAPGTATITAKATDDSGAAASLEITVVQPIKKITSTDTKLVIAPGTTWKPEITITPEDATMKKLAWTSSNDKIANVDENGEISAVAVGKCNIIGAATDDSRQKITISLQVKEHDVLILVPGEVQVNFQTRASSYGSYIQIGRWSHSETEDTTVTFKNGLVCEGSKEGWLRPLKPGSETIEIVTKHNGKKVTGKSTYTVFIAQTAVTVENEETIGRLEAESYGGHTYQIFYSGRSWDEAEAFCEKLGGHLATITGENEQKFLERYLAKAEKQQSYWIGLTTGKSKAFSTWVTKEAISYTKWMDGNPDRNQPESCARIAASEYADQNNWTMSRGTWDDESNTYYYINGFICEWDEENSPNALPVAGAAANEGTGADEPLPDASSIPIRAGEESPYGKELTLNAGKDSENTFTGYFLPAGTYTVTNRNPDNAIKITLYENVRQTIEGSEEFKTAKDQKPVMLFPGKTGELTFSGDQFVLFSDEEFDVLFEKK